MDGQDRELVERLCEALLSLKDAAECGAFLTDLCTIKEMGELARRLEVAKLLDAGQNYLDIAGRTGVSTATISRVNRALRYGEGGYRLVLARLKKEQEHA